MALHTTDGFMAADLLFFFQFQHLFHTVAGVSMRRSPNRALPNLAP